MVGTQRYKRGFVKKQSNKITDSGESYYISISIENIQRRATKFILNHPDRKTSYTARLKTLSLLQLEFKREVHDLVILCKTRSGLINASFDNLLLPATIYTQPDVIILQTSALYLLILSGILQTLSFLAQLNYGTIYRATLSKRALYITLKP